MLKESLLEPRYPLRTLSSMNICKIAEAVRVATGCPRKAKGESFVGFDGNAGVLARALVGCNGSTDHCWSTVGLGEGQIFLESRTGGDIRASTTACCKISKCSLQTRNSRSPRYRRALTSHLPRR